MTIRLRYYLYLLTFCLVSAISVQAQFSEEDLEKQANELFESEKYAEAMPLFSQLLSLNPTNPVYNFKYGATALYGDSDKKEEAVKFLKFASKNKAIDNKVWYFLGRAYHLNYQFADAETAYIRFKENASGKDVESLELTRHLNSARNGLSLLSKIKDVKVLDKKRTSYDSFFRVYELAEIGGKILVTPDELLSSLDKKKNHKSLIHFRGTGTTVYFSSYGKDGKTGLDIYKAQVLPGGEFSSPVKLGGLVNTDYDEDFPFMHPDGKTFYFSSTGHSSMGGFDIFKCFYDQNMDVFSQPENLDFAINTPDDELFYIADTANNMANFASARSSKQGELHVYRVLVQSKPIELTLVKGAFINRINPSENLAKIAVVDAATNEKVSEQYTDPQNGDYVVSVPKNGKYKFIVEVQNSDKVHAGLVDIPRSSGVKAYLQEMELVLSAGVEKLLINNRFDETYNGDVLALAKDLLRKQAELDVNFYPESQPVIEEEPESDQDFALAYKVAGFPAGMSNQDVLNAAKAREVEFQNTLNENLLFKARATDLYIEKTAQANIKITEAEEKVRKANRAESSEKARLMFSAAILKTEATQLLGEAESANELVSKIDAANRELEESMNVVSLHADSLEAALNSEDYNQVKRLMKKENAVQKGEYDSFKIADLEAAVTESSFDSKNRADQMMDRSTGLRREADALNSKLITKKRQLERAKGKDAKELEEEVARLESEAQNLEESIETSYRRAVKFQEVSDSEQRQYEMYTEFKNSEKPLSPEETEALLNTEIGTADLSSYFNKLEDLALEQELVAEYARENPGEFEQFNPETRRTIAAVYLSGQDDTGRMDDGEFLAENQTSAENDLSKKQIASAENESSENSEGEIEKEIAEVEPKPASEIVSGGAESEINSADKESENLKEIETGELALTEKESPPEVGNEDRETDVKDESLTPEQQVDAERIKIKAAEDWLTVINSSIDDLEQGVGGDEDESIEAQLTEYKQLREQKLKEIESSEKVIADITENMESIPGEVLAIQRAEKDMEALSNAQIASIEAKVSIASSDADYVRDLSVVDADYIPQLTAAELSGLSAPEIASKRIEINKELLVSLDKLINKEATTDVSDERLLELRRIKLTEIKEDEKVAIGALAYAARTTEAKEYQELISTSEGANESQMSDLSSLSPKMQEDLNTSFSRSLIMDNYDEELALISENLEDSVSIQERLKLRKEYLNSLQSEISFYAQTLKSQGANAPDELKDRYNDLLADRSEIADEIQADQNLMSNLTTRNLKESSTELVASQSELDLPELESISKQFTEAYEAKLQNIKELELPEAEELKALATIKFEQSEQADSMVVVYMDQLDRSGSSNEKDEIQQLIQYLDALAADQKQEADRLVYESDILANASREDEQVVEETVSIDLPEIKDPVVPSNIPFEALEYKSLNANIAYSKLENRVDSLTLEKSALEDMVEAYNASGETDVKRELLSKIEQKEANIQRLEKSLIRDVSESNAAEIAYYQKENARLIKSIETEFSENADLAEYGERESEISEMLSKNEKDKAQGKKTESDYLADELALISSLSDLNEDMDSFIQTQSATDENLASNSINGAESPYELLMRNPENHKPEAGKKYLNPIYRNVDSTLSNERRNEIIELSPEIGTSTDFVYTEQESVEKEILSKSTSVDQRGYDLLKADPEKLSYVLSAVRADSLKTLENQNAALSGRKSLSANEKYAEVNRLRGMVVHQNSEADKKIVQKRADMMEKEAELDLEVAALAAISAEELRVKRLTEEEKLAIVATNFSSTDLNELNALLRRETYTIIPNVDLGTDQIASISEPKKAPSEPISPEPAKPETSESYSEDELDLFNKAGNWLAVVDIIAEKNDFSDVKESLFIESEKSAYSDKNPIPIDPVMPNGLVFQVQVGAFRNPIPQDLYKDFAPVMGQRLENGITRYRAGLFRIYKEAKNTRDAIRARGYSDAFVVVYVDGERLSGAQARQILAQARDMVADSDVEATKGVATKTGSDTAIADQQEIIQKQDAAEEVGIKEEINTAYYNDPEAAEAKQVEITQGLFYTVQVGVYSKPVKLDQLFNLTELNSELTSSGYIRYTSGRYVKLSEANNRKNLVVQKGVTDAFITAYYNGKRISLDQAKKLLEEKGDSIFFNEGSSQTDDPISEDTIEYIVIMGILNGDVPEELANSFAENEDWNIQKTTGPQGQEMYVSPKFKNRSEAMEFLKLAKESGVESAVMGKMTNGSITEVNTEN